MDASRQFQTDISRISKDHLSRYKFAKTKVSGLVLDAACGIGYGSKILSDSCDVVGVDIEPEAIEAARKYYPGQRYIIADIASDPFRLGVDSIVCLETIEHLRDPEKCLKWFRSGLRGTMVISTPNEDYYPFSAEKFAGDTYPHIRHYKPQEFDTLLADAGFKVLERYCQKSKADVDVVDGTDGRFLVYVCI